MYTPSEVIFTYGGIILNDFAKGTFISIADQVADKVSMTKSNNNGGGFNFDADTSAIITGTILQSSFTNDALMAKFALIEQGVLGPEELLIEDPNGTRLAFCEKALIMGRPNEDYGDTIGNNAWRFACLQLNRFVGSTANL